MVHMTKTNGMHTHWLWSVRMVGWDVANPNAKKRENKEVRKKGNSFLPLLIYFLCESGKSRNIIGRYKPKCANNGTISCCRPDVPSTWLFLAPIWMLAWPCQSLKNDIRLMKSHRREKKQKKIENVREISRMKTRSLKKGWVTTPRRPGLDRGPDCQLSCGILTSRGLTELLKRGGAEVTWKGFYLPLPGCIRRQQVTSKSKPQMCNFALENWDICELVNMRIYIKKLYVRAWHSSSSSWYVVHKNSYVKDSRFKDIVNKNTRWKFEYLLSNLRGRFVVFISACYYLQMLTWALFYWFLVIIWLWPVSQNCCPTEVKCMLHLEWFTEERFFHFVWHEQKQFGVSEYLNPGTYLNRRYN